MIATNDLFIWFCLDGLNGMGGWFLFFLLALAAVIFVLYDSTKRQLAATGWKMGVVLLAALMLPIVLFRFSSLETKASLGQFLEVFFYLGLLGGLLPAALAVGYFVTFRGFATCERGHLYDTSLGNCPQCRRMAANQMPAAMSPMPQPAPHAAYQAPAQKVTPVVMRTPSKQVFPAWLVSDGHNYQLFCGSTTVGRGGGNDIQIGGDVTISRTHAKLIETNGHFKLYDLGSNNGTFVNGHRVDKPQLIHHGDDVRFGDNLTMRFTSSS